MNEIAREDVSGRHQIICRHLITIRHKVVRADLAELKLGQGAADGILRLWRLDHLGAMGGSLPVPWAITDLGSSRPGLGRTACLLPRRPGELPAQVFAEGSLPTDALSRGRINGRVVVDELECHGATRGA